MNLKDFLVGIGHELASVFGIIKNVVPKDKLIAGIQLAEEAAIKFTDNADRRHWVIEQLMKRFPIGESIARLIVELAVAKIKHDVEKGVAGLDAAVQG